MPFSSRGAQYYGNASQFLNCGVDHDKLANELYSKIFNQNEPYGKTSCENCGAYITVSIHGIEWETKVFSRPPLKER